MSSHKKPHTIKKRRHSGWDGNRNKKPSHVWDLFLLSVWHGAQKKQCKNQKISVGSTLAASSKTGVTKARLPLGASQSPDGLSSCCVSLCASVWVCASERMHLLLPYDSLARSAGVKSNLVPQRNVPALWHHTDTGPVPIGWSPVLKRVHERTRVCVCVC